MPGQHRPQSDQPSTAERAATMAATWWTRRFGRAPAQSAWQMLADAARLGVIRHGRPEAWAAGATIALARVRGQVGPGREIAAQEVADDFDVPLGALAVTERELANALQLGRYAGTPSG